MSNAFSRSSLMRPAMQPQAPQAGGGGGGGGNPPREQFGGKTVVRWGDSPARVAMLDVGDEAKPITIYAYGAPYKGGALSNTPAIIPVPWGIIGAELTVTWGGKRGSVTQKFPANRRFTVCASRVDVYADLRQVGTYGASSTGFRGAWVELNAFCAEGADGGNEPPPTWQTFDPPTANAQLLVGPGTLLTLEGTNLDAAGAVYVQVYDSPFDPTDSSGAGQFPDGGINPAPLVSQRVSAGQPFSFDFGSGLTVQTGAWFVASSTPTTPTPVPTSLSTLTVQSTTY